MAKERLETGDLVGGTTLTVEACRAAGAAKSASSRGPTPGQKLISKSGTTERVASIGSWSTGSLARDEVGGGRQVLEPTAWWSSDQR
jgi:hypothetical protein